MYSNFTPNNLKHKIFICKFLNFNTYIRKRIRTLHENSRHPIYDSAYPIGTVLRVFTDFWYPFFVLYLFLLDVAFFLFSWRNEPTFFGHFRRCNGLKLKRSTLSQDLSTFWQQ